MDNSGNDPHASHCDTGERMNIRRYIPVRVKNILKRIRCFLITGFTQITSIGYRYACPVCGKKVKAFEPLPGYYKENLTQYGSLLGSLDEWETINEKNYSCPNCSSSDRDRLYARYFTQKLARLKPGMIFDLLDVAPTRSLKPFLLKYTQLRYRSADLNRKGVDDVIDITDMHVYEDNRFDIFICSHVLEHVADDRKAISELFRVLKPGGWGILMVPIYLKGIEIDEDPSITDVGERWRRFGQHDHVRVYSKAGFINRVREAGFKIQQYGKEYFGRQVLDKYGITDQSVLYIVEK
jgi:predicted SAM-dependent methyltransferase